MPIPVTFALAALVVYGAWLGARRVGHGLAAMDHKVVGLLHPKHAQPVHPPSLAPDSIPNPDTRD